MENVHLDVISKVKLSDKQEIQTFNWMEGIPSLSRKKVSHLMYYSKVSYFSWFTSQSKNWISIISEESQKKNNLFNGFYVWSGHKTYSRVFPSIFCSLCFELLCPGKLLLHACASDCRVEVLSLITARWNSQLFINFILWKRFSTVQTV